MVITHMFNMYYAHVCNVLLHMYNTSSLYTEHQVQVHPYMYMYMYMCTLSCNCENGQKQMFHCIRNEYLSVHMDISADCAHVNSTAENLYKNISTKYTSTKLHNQIQQTNTIYM